MICIIKTPLFAKFSIKNGDHITKKNVIAVGVLFLVFQTYLILSAARTSRSSDIMPLYAKNRNAIENAGKPPANST